MRADDGRTVEVDRPMAHPPKRVTRDGVVYRRVYTVPEAKVSINPHFVSHSLPLGTRGPDGRVTSPYSNDVDQKTRKPRFSSWKQIREAEARSRGIDGAKAVAYD